MKDLDRLMIRFQQFGGLRLVWEYVKLGILWLVVKEFFKCVVRRKSFKAIYPAILRDIEPILIEKYLNSINEVHYVCKFEDDGKTRIWWCWLQGFDKAPKLAKCCLKSLQQLNTEIVVIDNKNYKNWVELPEYIVKKYEAGNMPSALFSDVLRLALLIKHGGVWIDSTVFCTGSDAKRYSLSWEEICHAELFLFQYTRPGEKWSGNIGNWFIAAKPGNPLLMQLYDALCRYWKVNNVTIDYYIFHLFFSELAKQYVGEIEKMPYGWATPCLQLGLHLGDEYDENTWKSINDLTNWHKMNYRHEVKLKTDAANYYTHICSENSISGKNIEEFERFE